MTTQINITGGISYDDFVKEGDSKRSVLYVTCNPNQSFYGPSPEFRASQEKLDRVTRAILNSFDEFVTNEKGGPIIRRDATYTVERGSVNHRTHCHFIVEYTHQSHIKFNTMKLAAVMTALLDRPQGSIHFKFSFPNDSIATLKDYVRKGQMKHISR